MTEPEYIITRTKSFFKISFLVRAEKLFVNNIEYKVDGIVEVRSQFMPPELAHGDKVIMLGRLQEPKKFKFAKSNFDYPKWLRRQGIYKLLFIEKPEHIERIVKSKGVGIFSFFPRLRGAIREGIENSLSFREASMTKAITIGNRSWLNAEVIAAFSNSGTMHILAISGLHVGIVLFCIYHILAWIGIIGSLRSCLLIITTIGYMGITDFSPSVTRAGLMAIVYLGSDILFRKSDFLNSLIVSAFIILLIKPVDLYNIGFQMSYLSTLSIFLFVGYFERIKETKKAEEIDKIITEKNYKWYLKRIAKKILDYLISIILVSFAAQLVIWPLTAIYFQRINVNFILANLSIIPIATLFFVVALVYVPYFIFLAPSFYYLLLPLKLIVKFLWSTTSLFASLPYSYININSINYLAVFIYYAWLILFIILHKKIRLIYFILITFALFIVAIIS